MINDVHFIPVFNLYIQLSWKKKPNEIEQYVRTKK